MTDQTIDTQHAPETSETPTPAEDLKALGRLVGSWETTDPTGESGLRGTITYEWMEGGFFLVQRFDLEMEGHPVKGIEIIGHDRPYGATESGPDLRSRVYDTIGNTLDYVYELEGDTLTIWGGEKGSPAYFRGTFTQDGDELKGGWVWPGGGYKSDMKRTG